MTDAEFEQQKQRVQALIKKWLGPLGLRWLAWKTHYYRGKISDDEPNTIFKIYVRFNYQDVNLDCSCQLIAEMNDADLEAVFLHELGHVYTIPLKSAALGDWNAAAIHDLEENLATGIGRAFGYLRDYYEDQQTGWPTDEY